MKLAVLRELARIDLDDTVEPYLWSDDELDDAANEAAEEACRRARLLRDSTTAEITQIALTAGQTLVTLDPRVIRVERARIGAGSVPLALMLMRDVDRCYPGWEDYAQATPRLAVVDYQSQALRLVPPPDEAATLHLTVIRLPLAPMNDDEDHPEIPLHVHRALRHWMVFRARLNPDSQKLDKKGAADALSLFEAEFGTPQPIYDELWQQQHYAGRDYGHY